MLTKTTYLAGPMTGLTFRQANGWRVYACDYLAKYGITALSPMRGSTTLKDGDIIDAYYEVEGLGGENAVVSADRSDVMRSDVILFNFTISPRVSIGSIAEVSWADAWRKPVVAVLPKGNIHDHPFIRSLCQFKYQTLDEALQTVLRLLG